MLMMTRQNILVKYVFIAIRQDCQLLYIFNILFSQIAHVRLHFLCGHKYSVVPHMPIWFLPCCSQINVKQKTGFALFKGAVLGAFI
jgi:hypothetical protein